MNIQNIVELVKVGKKIEAQKELAKYLGKIEMTTKDVGHTYAEIAALYLRANNYLLSNYNAFLKDVVKELQALNKKENSLID